MKPKVTMGFIALTAVLVLAACTAMPARTGTVHGESGSPSATVTLSGEQLPPPVPVFGGVLLAFGLLSCHSCPDLAYRGITFEFENVEQPDSVIVTATRQSDGSTWGGCDHTAATACSLDPGAYDLLLEFEGDPFGQVSGICSPGHLTGCEAEEAEEETGPVVTVRWDGSDMLVALTRRGFCP